MSEWERCRPWIEAALAKACGTHTVEDVEAGLRAGDFQFWPGARAACVTEIIEFPRRRAINFWLAGGSLRELERVIEPAAAAWAKTQGCDMALGNLYDRPAWVRVWKRRGYEPGWRLFRRDL